MAVTTLGSSTEDAPPPPRRKVAPGALGDVDGDGFVSLADAELVQKITVGTRSADPDQLRRADVAGDGSVTTRDALFIARYARGMDDEFPKGTPAQRGETPAPGGPLPDEPNPDADPIEDEAPQPALAGTGPLLLAAAGVTAASAYLFST
jgi:hypothetical protein